MSRSRPKAPRPGTATRPTGPSRDSVAFWLFAAFMLSVWTAGGLLYWVLVTP